MELDDHIAGAVSTSARGAELKVWAVPGASRTEIVGMHAGAVRLRVAAPAHKGAANRAIAAFLAQVLDGPVEVLGRTSRSKRALIDLPPDIVVARLTERMTQ